MLFAFLQAVILAFGLIIPLGVQNIFIFNQGASQPKLIYALPSVLAASFCDTCLIVLAVLGVSLVVLHLAWLKLIIFVLGFLFLLYMGWVTWKSQPPTLDENFNPLTARKQIAFALSVSILNPHAIIDTIGVIGTSSLHYHGSEKWAFAIGCILVSISWFFGLAIAGHCLHRLDKNGLWLRIVNKLSAIIIWIVALYIGLQIYQTIEQTLRLTN